MTRLAVAFAARQGRPVDMKLFEWIAKYQDAVVKEKK
jgi:hypothetical protein